jgi:hypothetical protein
VRPVEEWPDEEQLRTFASWMRRGADLGDEFAELRQPAVAGSLLAEILELPSSLDDPRYDRGDAQFFVECLRGYVAISSAQLRGIAALLLCGPPVQLHPMMTLIRAQAEACGSAWWILDPLVDADGQDGEISDTERAALPMKVFDRSQLLRLEQLRNRRKRRRLETDLPRSEEVEQQLEAYEAELEARHGTTGLKWEKRKDGSLKRIIGVGEAQVPKLTELATSGVRYAYRGEAHGGKSVSPYPMLSGYAHGSIEMFFSHGQSPVTSLVRLVTASSNEVRVLTALVLRIHEALLDTVLRVAERNDCAVSSWSEEWWNSTRG